MFSLEKGEGFKVIDLSRSSATESAFNQERKTKIFPHFSKEYSNGCGVISSSDSYFNLTLSLY